MLTTSKKIAEVDSLRELLKELQDGQTSMKVELTARQVAMKEELKEDFEAGQATMKDLTTGQEKIKAPIVTVKETFEEKLSVVENRMSAVEGKVQEITVVEEKVWEIKENLRRINEIFR